MDELSTDPVLLCRAFFILATTVVFTVDAFPPLRRRFVAYGPRQFTYPGKRSPPKQSGGRFLTVLDYLARFQVPHSWFIHFYIISVTSSVFWAYQIIGNGQVFKFIASRHINGESEASSMTSSQVLLAWLVVALQGSRRLYECISLRRPSATKMSDPAWILGIAFYLVLGIVQWVEGIPTLFTNGLSLEHVHFSKPSMKTFIALPMFTFASGIQHDCHEHLAGLKKYSLPDHPFFRWILCPHYTSECIIYLSLAIIAAPQGQLLNKTVCTVLLFEAVNLGITAESTRAWYTEKFGVEKVQGRWRMVPFVY